MKYPFTSIRMAVIKKTTNNKCWRGCGEKGTLVYYGNVNWSSQYGKEYGEFSKKLKIELPCALLCSVTQPCPTLCNLMGCSPPGSSVCGGSPGKNTGVGCHDLLQGIFSTQGSDLGLPHCRWVLYYLSHLGNPYDPAIPPLGIFPKKIKTLTQKDIRTFMFTVVLFTIAKIWKQLMSLDRWMDKEAVAYIYMPQKKKRPEKKSFRFFLKMTQKTWVNFLANPTYSVTLCLFTR